jgi:hypothetical protein
MTNWTATVLALVVVVVMVLVNHDHMVTVSVFVMLDHYDVMMIAVMIVFISDMERYPRVLRDDKRFVAGRSCQRGHS